MTLRYVAPTYKVVESPRSPWGDDVPMRSSKLLSQ